MDPAEIPHRVHPEKKPCLDGESQQLSLASMLAAVSKVLDDDNLLIEILLCVGFPTTLVRAALVCKRWYHHASNRRFLSRFRELNPPRLLGFYLDDVKNCSVAGRFFPMLPQPPELAAIVRRTSFRLDPYVSALSDLMGCQNGSVLIVLYDGIDFTVGVHSPLRPGRGLAVLPPFPQLQIQDGFSAWKYLLTSAEEASGLSYLYVLVESNRETTKSTAHIHMLRHGDGVWRKHCTLATDQLLVARWEPKVELADNKIYIASAMGDIIVLDLTASSVSRIQLPQGVEYGDRDTRLARAVDASGVYLIHAKELQLRIWFHKGDNWLLVDTICLREMCANLGMLDHMVDDDPNSILRINHVGDYADFVFLEISRCALHLDVKSRQVRKVYELPEKDRCLGDIYPFMMIWPPIFPALKDDPARNAM